MATTSPDKIYSPDAGQQYALTQDLLAMADSVQAALNTRIRVFSGAGTPSVTGAEKLMDRFVSTTTGRTWTFRSTGWVADTRIVPATSIAGTTPPEGAPLIEYMGRQNNVTTNSNGEASIPYPAPFPNGVVFASLERINYGLSLGGTLQVLATTQSLSTLNFRVYTSSGDPLANIPSLQYLYRVIGW